MRYLYSTIAVIAMVLSFTSGAPTISIPPSILQAYGSHHTRTMRHLTTINTEIEIHLQQPSWVSPCGIVSIESTRHQKRGMKAPRSAKNKNNGLRRLREFLQNIDTRWEKAQHKYAIDISDIGLWNKHNAKFAFLHRINTTHPSINLRRWHNDTQIFVAAFQYLTSLQNRTDHLRNEGNATTVELSHLQILAKNLLCEIETVINVTNRGMPPVLTIQNMSKILRFTNQTDAAYQDVDELDKKFTKSRFYDYCHGLKTVLNGKQLKLRRANGKLNRANKQAGGGGKNRKTNVAAAKKRPRAQKRLPAMRHQKHQKQMKQQKRCKLCDRKCPNMFVFSQNEADAYYFVYRYRYY